MTLVPYGRRDVDKAAPVDYSTGEQRPRVIDATTHRVGRVVRHERTHRATWRTVTATITTLQGFESWGRRAWDASSHGVYRRQIRQAEASGDKAQLAEWVDRKESAVDRRHKRIMELPKLVGGIARILLGSLAALVGLVLVAGLVAQLSGEGRFADIVLGFLDVVRWCATAVAAMWTPLVALAPAALLVAAYREGKTRRTPPSWVAAHTDPTGGERDVVPDEGAVMRALGALGVTPLNRAVRDGWQPRFVMPATRDGKGWRTQLQLPMGVTVEMVNARKDVLAHNLLRHANEVWPMEPRQQPGVLDLWVADPGVLSGKVDPWPLLHDGTGDYFRGVPVGIDQRGQTVTGRLMAANYLVGGIMGSGKSSLVITLTLGALLDPLTDVYVFCMAYNVDFDPMRPALASLVKGDEDEQIAAAVEALRWLRGEVSRRGQVLEELGGDDAKLTRDIAERDDRMRPIVAVFDEVQELFEHPTYGKEARELAVKLTKKARKTGITCVWSTPTASADSLPRDLSRTASNRVAFAIGDHQGNDAILGTGAHKSGVSATSLVAGEDVGTAMAVGFSKQPGLLRTHHVQRGEGVDEVTPVVERALAARQQAPVRADRPEPERRDLLGDVADVLADDVENASQLAARLRDRPGYSERFNGSVLVDRLRRHHGIPLRKLKGYPVVRASDVRDALAARGVSDEQDDDEQP